MTHVVIDKIVGDRRMFRMVDRFNNISFLATKDELIGMKKTLDIMIGDAK